MSELRGYIHKYESFGAVDGPGVRFVLFMQGCPLKCLYCHNSNARCMAEGRKVTVENVVQEIDKTSNYFMSGGGLTVSGGEALAQPRFVHRLFTRAKAKGWHCCVDTSGAHLGKDQKKVLDITDLVILDIKSMNPEKHDRLTKWPLKKIITFARYLEEKNIPVWIRHVLVPTWTDDEMELRALGRFVKSLRNVERFEILPYHKLGTHKWEARGEADPLANVPAATKEQVQKARDNLRSVGVEVFGD